MPGLGEQLVARIAPAWCPSGQAQRLARAVAPWVLIASLAAALVISLGALRETLVRNTAATQEAQAVAAAEDVTQRSANPFIIRPTATSGQCSHAMGDYATKELKKTRAATISEDFAFGYEQMSAFQRAQMYSLQDPNIFNIAVTGLFDDAQDIVKAVSNDAAFKARYKIGAVNSINWARLLAGYLGITALLTLLLTGIKPALPLGETFFLANVLVVATLIAIVGVGAMGRGLAYQISITPGIECVALADVKLERASDCARQLQASCTVVADEHVAPTPGQTLGVF